MVKMEVVRVEHGSVHEALQVRYLQLLAFEDEKLVPA
jgi:hypothetical protein